MHIRAHPYSIGEGEFKHPSRKIKYFFHYLFIVYSICNNYKIVKCDFFFNLQTIYNPPAMESSENQQPTENIRGNFSVVPYHLIGQHY